MIINRFDYRMLDSQRGYGVGFQILETAAFDPMEVKLAVDLLGSRRKHFGDGVVAIDCGANIGVHTIEWANAMTGWGSVLAIEAQERIYYALAGNIAINNCFNAVAVHGAVSSESGVLQIPTPDYCIPSSFGSLELRRHDGNEFIGQPIDYDNTVAVRKLMLDEFGLPRVDLIKLDGREPDRRGKPPDHADREDQDRRNATAPMAGSARLRGHRGGHQHRGRSRQRQDACRHQTGTACGRKPISGGLTVDPSWQQLRRR
jgi:FkbM family methyltransferase